jgi:DHA1 family multidrug resistance protein-like MFS transporter
MQCIFVYLPFVYPQYSASLFAGNDAARSFLAFAAGENSFELANAIWANKKLVMFAHP